MADRLEARELRSFLERFDPAAQRLAGSARSLVLEVFPDAVETAEGREIGFGFDRGSKGLVFAISLKRGGLNLGVADGVSLTDPDGLLKGEGKRHRRVPIMDEAVLRQAALRSLMERALARRRSGG